MKPISIFFIIGLLLSCHIKNISAEYLRLNTYNLYVQINQDALVIFTSSKQAASKFKLTDEIFIHGRIGFSKKFNLVHESQVDSLFLVCDDNGLRLITQKEYFAKKFFWKSVNGYENCICYHCIKASPGDADTKVDSSGYGTFSIEE